MPSLVGVRLADARLGAAHEVVAEQPDRAAGERRQALQRRELPARHLLRHVARTGSGCSPRRSVIVERGRSPRNDQRPTRWPCSADSSRNDGPSPRSFRYAETGVSQSATNVWRSGTSVCSRASSRTSSRLGETRSPAGQRRRALSTSYASARLQPARGQQHGQVVEHVGRLARHALVGLLARRAGDLLGLLLDLRADARRVGEQLGGVAALGRSARLRSAIVRSSAGSASAGRRLHVAAVEAGPLARVAGRAGRVDERHERVRVAVVAQRHEALDVARGLAFVPQLLARAAPEPDLAGLARAPVAPPRSCTRASAPRRVRASCTTQGTRPLSKASSIRTLWAAGAQTGA